MQICLGFPKGAMKGEQSIEAQMCQLIETRILALQYRSKFDFTIKNKNSPNSNNSRRCNMLSRVILCTKPVLLLIEVLVGG